MAVTLDVTFPGPSTGAPELGGVLGLLCAEDFRLDPADVLDVEDLELAHLDAGAVVEVLTASQALLDRAQAVQLRAIEELRRRRGDDRDTADEVGLALSVSKHAADRQVGLAQQLTTRFPRVLAAMTRGELDAYKAERVVETAYPLPDELARELDAAMQGLLAGRDATAIQQSASYRVKRLDPEGADQRAERRRRDRRIELRPRDDGMADLLGYLPAEHACAAYARIDAIAKSCKTRRDPRTLDEIRADVFAELLLGTNLSHRNVTIQVTVPATTLLGTTDLPADLEGYGWIPAAIARAMAADPNCTWRRLITDPATGQLLEVGRTRYRPPAPLDDYVRARDRHCRVAGCRRPATRCDVDHNHDWDHGGETNECLLCCLCRRHHRLKDRPGWDFTLDDGDLIITTPTGRQYRSQPPPCTPPEPELEPPPDNSPPPY